MPASSDGPAPQLDWRTNAAILVGMAVPVAALALMAWLLPAGPAGALRAPVIGAGISAIAHPARAMRVEVLASYPHDPEAFTQGLLYLDGVLYESTGLEGESTMRRVDVTTGRVLERVALAPDQFGQGIARTPEGLIQLTWQNDTGFVYDPTTLARRRQFAYAGDGMGLCHDGTSLVMGDGSPVLMFRRPDTFAVHRTIHLTLDDAPLWWVNELECANGSIYGNVWRRDFIVRIDPATGVVRERIDARGLLTSSEARGVDFLNGIAYDPVDGTFYLTGERWPKLFKVRFVPADT